MQRHGIAGWREARADHSGRAPRAGAILVWLALLMVLLLGMVGLVIDAGLLMATHRHAQNAADAAALAAADDLLRGMSSGQATTTATTYVQQRNGAADWTPEVHIPPTSGAYAGLPNYAEVIVTAPMQTFFIHILGVNQNQQVRARAVAGSESYAGGEGVIVLDPDARPGLKVSGTNTVLRVLGRVVVNSEGGGKDENGVEVVGDPPGSVAASTGGSTPNVFAADIRVVGGVDVPTNFVNVDPNDATNVLHCREMRYPDPFAYLPIPITTRGVDPTDRGSVDATSGGLNFTDPSGQNYIETNPATGQPQLVLLPGIYDSISITGGEVVLVPGIYVLAPKKNVTNSLKIIGGTVTAVGVMFYNTANSYSPDTGTPDVNDGESPPPKNILDLTDGSAYWGAFQMNASMEFTPIDLTATPPLYPDPRHSARSAYARAPDPVYDGMLFFQRRRNNQPFYIEGNAAEGNLAGTLYMKWALTSISGQGTYNAQFVVGSMDITGNGIVTVNYTGQKVGKAPAVFLVE